ncbi:gamma-aminobutyric acid receptor alpha-like [Frankliniella occidentalis]|uniref:Gamma-aminobutyric acid receptor alpha-like n=1 Tax=Frankliniella occidentalis TaxID=133901 RepID=A0A9C6XBH1_FRAOC|nr:gamma-aminobutyric acid receptor alpha-like [Frankliniella occidentalis]
MVRSMGPISEVDMTYSMDCYFRQSWVDRRLAFQGNKETLALSITMLERIWKPDTYFYNGKQSYLHTITTPNKFVRLYQNGRVLYSSRLTIKAGCPMHLDNFPMDIQKCPLKFGSFGYTTRDVLYRWNTNRQVAIADDMKLSQFDLIGNPTNNQTDVLKTGEHSMLLVSFHLQRHMGNFLIQVYGPCILLVVLSWVSFWLNREATADRVSLGITTVLTMTFLGLEARTDLPKVPYPTALDFFVFLSFAFIFATIIQFAVVHYFTKYGSGECYFSADFMSDSESDEDEVRRESARRRALEMPEVIPLELGTLGPLPLGGVGPGAGAAPAWSSWSCFRCGSAPSAAGSAATSSAPSAASSPAVHMRTRVQPAPSAGHGHRLSLQGSRSSRTGRRRHKPRTPRFNSVSQIDRASRVFFPLLFLTINIAYWCAYLSRSQRIAH